MVDRSERCVRGDFGVYLYAPTDDDNSHGYAGSLEAGTLLKYTRDGFVARRALA